MWLPSKDDIYNDLEVNPWLRLRNRFLRIILSPYRLTKALFMITGAIVWCTLLVIGIWAYWLVSTLPAANDFEQIKRDAESHLTSLSAGQTNIIWTPLSDINRELLYAIVMSEDGDFFIHQGIDYDAMISALGENIKRREWSYGASTISQQTAKNLYFSGSKSLYRKMKEFIITKRLESHLSKNDILEVYLNLVEFGPDIYGVHDASQYYFSKRPDELNAAQGAFLALLMPSPRKYHYTIFKNQHMAPRHKRKYKRILQDMRYKELISPRQYNTYINWAFF